ncbi:Transposase, TnpA family [Legionella massiliensis]|uniref:Transposase, TnpA family n=1 Tax=Legionella massiliensis TaxID=1034943 RepID=A0A078KUY0_9GAMM|nr:Transposase, TnpA family [Legionella massiliensis]CEE12579.1 Tn3 transposase DDE domain protein [Legionella massiliensis]
MHGLIPFFHYFLAGTINKLNKRVFTGKGPFVFCVFTYLAMKSFKEIWVADADRYRNLDDDLPLDFEANRENYYQDLGQTTNTMAFVEQLRSEMGSALELLNREIPKNRKVRILSQGKNRISITPLTPQQEPMNLAYLKREITGRWPMTSLLDVLKEADLRIGFSNHFKTVANRENLDRQSLQQRILLCLYGMGTNTGLKRISGSRHGISHKELLNVRRHFIHKAALPMLLNRLPMRFLLLVPHRYGERARPPVPQIPRNLAPGIKT